MNEPLISVIIPIYKVEQYLRRCIDSVLIQTYYNLEIYLVDDGSPDTCPQICDEYAQNDERIKVIHKQNGGLSDARNVAIDVATGEYIVFIDSDDYVTPDYVETLYSLVKKYSCEMAVSNWQEFIEGNDPVVPNMQYQETCWFGTEAIEKMFYQDCFDTSACGKIYKHNLFEGGIRYPNGLLFEDLATTYLLLAKCDKVAWCNKRTYYYMLRPNSIEGTAFSPAKMDSAMKIFDSMEAHSEIISKVEKAYRCRMFSFAFHILLKMPKDYSQRDILCKRIYRDRWKVLTDSRARKKARVAAAVSYLGLNTVKHIFSLIDQRKQ